MMYIAVLEDHADTREILRIELSSNYDVEVFATFTALLEAIREREFDVVITDSIVDGNRVAGQLLDFIRENRQSQPRLRVILLTGDTTYNEETATAAGFDGFLLKPYDSAEIRLMIDRLSN